AGHEDAVGVAGDGGARVIGDASAVLDVGTGASRVRRADRAGIGEGYGRARGGKAGVRARDGSACKVHEASAGIEADALCARNAPGVRQGAQTPGGEDAVVGAGEGATRIVGDASATMLEIDSGASRARLGDTAG